jgi:hypothetical protein
MHVDMVSPAVRIVPGDALERFLATLVKSPVVLDPVTVSKIAETIAGIQESEEPEIALREKTDKAAGKRPHRPAKAASTAGFRLTRNHWIILGALIVFNVLLSCVLLYLVFILNR